MSHFKQQFFETQTTSSFLYLPVWIYTVQFMFLNNNLFSWHTATLTWEMQSNVLIDSMKLLFFSCLLN